MTPKECKEKLLELAALMDELPENVDIIHGKANWDLDSVFLMSGLEAAADALGLAIEEQERDPYADFYERYVTTLEGVRIYQFEKQDREAVL